MSSVGSTSNEAENAQAANEEITEKTIFDPGNPAHVTHVWQAGFMATYAQRMGYKIMNSVRSEEPIDLS